LVRIERGRSPVRSATSRAKRGSRATSLSSIGWPEASTHSAIPRPAGMRADHQLGAGSGDELRALTVLVDRRQRAGGRREQVTHRLGGRLQQFSMTGRGECRAQIGGQPGQLTQRPLNVVGHRRRGRRMCGCGCAAGTIQYHGHAWCRDRTSGVATATTKGRASAVAGLG
jgi:hypothetical protein